MKKYFSSIYAKLIYSILFILALQSLSGSFTKNEMTWYKSLNTPPLVPKSYVFGIIWPILYIIIAISFWKVWISKKKRKSIAYSFFFLQLFFNFAWTFCFFYFKNISLALVDIILLDIFLVFTIVNFTKISFFSGMILVPYAIWVFFATYLNFGYWILN